MREITVKPSRPGLRVLDENNREYPANGKTVKRTPWVIRRLRDGDLVEIEKPKPNKKGDSK